MESQFDRFPTRAIAALGPRGIKCRPINVNLSLQCLQYFFYAFAMLLQYFYNTLTFTIFDVVYTLYFEAMWNNVVL